MPVTIPNPGLHELVEAIPSVNAATLNALLAGSREPVLVSFQAPGWEALALDNLVLADSFATRLRVVHVNVAAYPDLLARFKIRVIPTLLLFMHGVLTEFIVGIIPARFLIERLSAALGEHVNLNVPVRCRVRDNPRPSSVNQRPWVRKRRQSLGRLVSS